MDWAEGTGRLGTDDIHHLTAEPKAKLGFMQVGIAHF